MDQTQSNYFIEPITEDQRKQILAHIKATPSSIKADLQALREWYSQQPHLPKWNFTDNELLVFLVIEKGSIEGTKNRIDSFFYFKTAYYGFYENLHPLLPRMKEARKMMTCVILPKLTKDNARILIYRNNPTDEPMGGHVLFGNGYNLGILRMLEDMCITNEVIVDLKHATLKRAMSMSFSGLSHPKIAESFKKLPVKMVHVINPPTYVDVIIRTMRSFIKPKVAERIVVHESLDSLKNYVEERILPKDYGGSERSIEELEEITERKFEEYKEHFDRLEEAKTEEELRPEKCVNDEFLGYHGNFKKLEVD